MAERNYDGVWAEQLRKELDTRYNALHDELTECYYQKKPFRNYGVLTKEQFDVLHGLVFMHWHVMFDGMNLCQGATQDDGGDHGVPRKEYNVIYDEQGNPMCACTWYRAEIERLAGLGYILDCEDLLAGMAAVTASVEGALSVA